LRSLRSSFLHDRFSSFLPGVSPPVSVASYLYRRPNALGADRTILVFRSVLTTIESFGEVGCFCGETASIRMDRKPDAPQRCRKVTVFEGEGIASEPIDDGAWI
jgi:hypothetical protein